MTIKALVLFRSCVRVALWSGYNGITVSSRRSVADYVSGFVQVLCFVRFRVRARLHFEVSFGHFPSI